jgi:5-methylcytosine-specific restriction endonuclease McrA
MSPLLRLCRCGEAVERAPCPRCKQELAARKVDRSWRERQRRKRVVAAWVREHGYVCPGYGRPAHPASDLTADHITPRSGGGEHGPLRVLCRRCNSARGARRP